LNLQTRGLLQGLERLYSKYNHRKYVHPDPLEFLYKFPDPADREIIALLAACLAYGRVWQILRSINWCLDILDYSPKAFLVSSTERHIEKTFADFSYRFTKGPEMARFMIGLKRAVAKYGRLENIFTCNKRLSGAEATIGKVKNAVDELLNLAELPKTYLLPDPAKKSACKRLFLFLRWMVRTDEVDPGGWTSIASSDLVIPLDTHMFHIARDLGFTKRKQANLATALEITAAFKNLRPDDPVKYDFVLTRFGIRDELSRDEVRMQLRL